MPTAEQSPIPMPSILVVALTVVSVILLTTAVAFAPVAVFAVAWGSPVGYLGAGVWLLVAILTLLIMAGKAWARFGVIALPIALGVLTAASDGSGFVSIVVLATGMALVAVCLLFHSSSNAYFRALAAGGRGDGTDAGEATRIAGA